MANDKRGTDTTNHMQSHSYEDGRNYGHSATEAGVSLVLGNDPDFNQGARDGRELAQDGRGADGSRR